MNWVKLIHWAAMILGAVSAVADGTERLRRMDTARIEKSAPTKIKK